MQVVHNIAGMQIDVYIDDVLLLDDWQFQSATGFADLVPTTSKLQVLHAEAEDNSQPLAEIELNLGVGSAYQIVAFWGLH